MKNIKLLFLLAILLTTLLPTSIYAACSGSSPTWTAALTANDELDVDGTMVSVMCIAQDLWKVTGYMGDIPTDGDAAD